MSATKSRVVIDTQVFLRAGINRRSVPGKVVFDFRDQYILVTSAETSAEVAEVVRRPELQQKFKTLTEAVAQELDRILTGAQQVTLEEIPAISRDPKDDIFLACAKAADAQYIVSEDKDLLSLNPFDGIQIINALEFLQVLQPPTE